jgi:hypothetical protein
MFRQASESSSDVEKYKTTLNFDDLTPNSSLGLLSSHNKSKPQMYCKPTDKSNLKIEELGRDSKWQQAQSINDSSFLSGVQDLISQKTNTDREIERINGNKYLSKKDRQIAIKSVRSLSRTIDDLLHREKSKIGSQLATSQMMS